jgi:hypothetical protein
MSLTWGTLTRLILLCNYIHILRCNSKSRDITNIILAKTRLWRQSLVKPPSTKFYWKQSVVLELLHATYGLKDGKTDMTELISAVSQLREWSLWTMATMQRIFVTHNVWRTTFCRVGPKIVLQQLYLFYLFTVYLGASVAQYTGSVYRAIGVRSPAEAKSNFTLSSVSRPDLGPTQPPVPWVQRALSPGLKRGRGVTLTTHPHLVPRSRMSRSYTFSPPKRLHGV